MAAQREANLRRRNPRTRPAVSPNKNFNLLFSKQAPEPPIVCAAQSPDILTAAFRYAELGLSVLPLRGKQPNLRTWKLYQARAVPLNTLRAWASAGLFQNVGIVCGAASDNLIVIDLDKEAAYAAFIDQFPQFSRTFTVLTGSRAGFHVYLRPARLLPPVRALHTPIGNIELFSTGQQVAAPPSRHPQTGRLYQVHKPLDILSVPDLDEVAGWIRGLIRDRPERKRGSATHHKLSAQTAYHNPVLFEALANHFRQHGYRQRGPWLNGPCIYPERHAHADAKPSFGFNTVSGYGLCFLCGSMLAKEIAYRLQL